MRSGRCATLALAALALAGGGCVPAPDASAPAPAETALPAAAETPLATPTEQWNAQAWLRGHLADVDPARLMADVEALSAIPSRHVNHPGVVEAAGYIERAFRDAGLDVQSVEFPLEFRGVTTQQRDVVGIVPGAIPDSGVILIGAHYDSRTRDIGDWQGRAPGANDNATGVAVLLELARLLGTARPERAVYLAAFTAEETGLQGSRAFVANGRTGDVRGAVILDIVGNSGGQDGASLRVFSQGPQGSAARQLARWIETTAGAWVPDLPIQVQETIDRPGRWSDHVPLTEAGIPAVRWIEEPEHLEWQHNELDTPDRLDAAFLARVTKLALAVSIELASGPDVLAAP